MFSKTGLKLISGVSRLLRLCHTNTFDQVHLQGLHIIQTLEKVVDPFTKIFVVTPMHLKIIPIDLNIHPNGDKLIMSMFSNKDEGITQFSIKPSAKTLEIIGMKKNANSDAVCVIQAPIRASFDIQGEGVSNLSMEGMHSDECSLKTNSGDIILNNVKGKSLQIRSEKGSVYCSGTLLAENIDFKTGSTGCISCEHLRANSLKLNTFEGNISVESCYSDESQFTSVMGSLRLSNVHKNCTVEILERGDLQMTGFDGTLKAILKRGNVNLQASRLFNKNNIFIHDVGMVDIRVPETFTSMCWIDVIARQLNMDEELLKYGKMSKDALHEKFRCGVDKMQDNVNELLVDCRNGSVNVTVSSWKKMMEEKLSPPSDYEKTI